MTVDAARAKSIFLNASDLADPVVRAAYLDRECGGDAELRGRVEALLRANDAAPLPPPEVGAGTSKQFSIGSGQTQVFDDPTADIGSIIGGRYKLIEAIGDGGMGSVWLAEQKEPVRRKVALKLIKAGMDSKSVLARFEAERQALAVMDHPNIAKVFDGGMTEQGRPYFVMEYVKGVPLTEYCDQARLSLMERLNLFTAVCQAVQHAHQKGIIHRDLKPSNILICLYDGKPVPKVIDFGLAKAMHQSLTEHSLHTAHGMMVGTPLYMSPEQAEHNNLDVDTRTDIYSLGVILYELLTGSTPLERQQLKEAAFNEILRLIKEVEPPKPSTRLSGSASLPSIAAQRSIEPNQLRKSLTGDLDWIVMKALEKERSRRYETANGLARDVERFLNDEAVEACPPSTAYRLKKLFRRNKGTVLAASLVLLALVAGTAAVLGVQARANANLRSVNRQLDTANNALTSTNTLLDQQRTRAEEREQQAIAAVKGFGDAVSNNVELKNNPALETLRKSLLNEPLAFFKDLRERLQADSDTRPESLARLWRVAFDLGNLTDEIGDKADALRAFQESLKICERLVQENPTVTEYQSNLAGTHFDLGALHSSTGQSTEALAAYEQVRSILERLVHENPTVTDHTSHDKHILAVTHNNLGNILKSTGKMTEALAAYEQARAIHERLVRENPTVTKYQSNLAITHMNLGQMLCDNSQLTEGLAAFEQARAILERLVQQNPTVTAYQSVLARSHHTLGNLLRVIGQPQEALAACEQARAIQKRLVREHPTVTDYQRDLDSTLGLLADLELDAKRFTEARDLYREANEHQQRILAANPGDPEARRLLYAHYLGLLSTAAGLQDVGLAREARQGLADLASGDPEGKALDQRQQAVLGGEPAKDSQELLALGLRAYNLQRFALAARWFGEALERDPQLADDRRTMHAYNAACFAALAASGQGLDDPMPDESTRQRLRSQALTWLTSELDRWTKFLDSATPQQRHTVTIRLTQLQTDTDLAGIRDESELAKLPAAEQAALRKFWADVAELLEKSKT